MANFGLRKVTGEWVVGVDILKSVLVITGDPYSSEILFMNLVQAQKSLYTDFPKKKEKTEWLQDFEIADRFQLIKDRIAFIKQKVKQDADKKNQPQVEITSNLPDNKHKGQHFEVGCPSCD